jgi:hypothetical protein
VETKETESQPEAPQVPVIPPPPSAGPVSPARAQPAPVPAAPAVEAKAPEPLPPPPPVAALDLSELQRLHTEAREMLAQLAAEKQAAAAERRLAFARSFGGGLAHPDLVALMPAVDPASAEGAKQLTEWAQARPQLFRTPPVAAPPPPSEAEQRAVRALGHRPPTAAQMFGLPPEGVQ